MNENDGPQSSPGLQSQQLSTVGGPVSEISLDTATHDEEIKSQMTSEKTSDNNNNSSHENNNEVNNPSQSDDITLTETIFEHFIVAGTEKENSDLQILYQYPPGKKLKATKIEQFCLPTKQNLQKIKRTPSGSRLNEILLGQPYLHDSNHSYVFRLTSDTTIIYGICISKMDILEGQYKGTTNIWSKFGNTSTQLDNQNINTSDILAGPRCYCLLSKQPFFRLHFEVLLSILAQERIYKLTQFQNDDGLHERDVLDSLQKRILQILDCYYSRPVPKPGETLYFDLPFHYQLKSTTFYCPVGDDESRLISDWVLIPTFKILGIENFMHLFCAMLLEKPTIILSKRSLGTVANVVLSVIPLLRPFKWQGLLIPILPTSLQEVLQAPVPFISGITELNINVQEAVIIDLDENKVFLVNETHLPKLPEGKKLMHNIQLEYTQLQAAKEKDFHNPLITSSEQMKLALAILNQLQQYTLWLLGKIQTHFQNSKLDLSNSHNQDYLTTTFVNSVAKENREFVKCFLATQHFSVYCAKNWTS